MSVRVRFAPSPTGNLHIGGARTALFNWLLARKTGGTFILRIEDTDEDRSTPEYEAVILRELRWCGIDWDEGPEVGGPFGPYRQSERADRYREAADKLLAMGHAYRCTCTVERLEKLREVQLASKVNPGYDRQCRDKNLGPDCGPHVIRLKVPEGQIRVDDLFKGQVVFDSAELDDIILVRTDGVPTYNFVVVVDDVAMKMTHVLRGEEHLNNTPKQVLIYDALEVPKPRFGHMPLILGPDGTKLSKRHGATAVANYRDMGILPEALVNYLARLGWSHANMELFSIDELLAVFDLNDIGSSPGKWDIDKLVWVNSHWMKRLAPEVLADRARPYFEKAGLPTGGRDLVPVVLAYRERAKTLVELADAAAWVFCDDGAVKTDDAAVAAFLDASAVPVLDGLVPLLEGLPTWDEPTLEAAIAGWGNARGLKLGKIAQPVRVAIVGQKIGPGLFQTLAIAGRETSLRRLRAGLDRARGAA